jgi:twinkle protein
MSTGVASVDTAHLHQLIRNNILSLCRQFFPHGKREGPEWKIGDVTGQKGDSLGIQLTGDKAGLWHDRATGQGGDFIELIMQNRGVSFPLAADMIGNALGICVRVETEGPRKEPKTAEEQSKPSLSEENPFGLPYLLSRQELALCVEAATRLASDPAQIQKVAGWRGWKRDTIRALALEPSLGIDSTGRLCFLYESGCKLRWRADGERQIRWAFGKPWLWRGGYIRQARTIFVTEGETDAVSLLDSGLEEDGQTLVVALPSASFGMEPWARLLADKKVIIATDSDEAGRRTAEHLFKALKSFAQSLEHFPLEAAQ